MTTSSYGTTISISVATILLLLLQLFLDPCRAFTASGTATFRRFPPPSGFLHHQTSAALMLHMMDPHTATEIFSGASLLDTGASLLDATSSTVISATSTTFTASSSSSPAALSSSLLLLATEPWVQPAVYVLDPFLNLMSVAMLARVVLSWYPEVKITTMPWLILTVVTEPLLRAVKGFVPPAFGVDITPVFWVAVFTFVHEILLGQQGLLTLKIKYGI